MDPALLEERKKFKERSKATVAVQKKKPPKAEVTLADRPTLKAKKKKSKFPRPKPKYSTGTNDSIKKAAHLALRSNNPARILKAVVDLMKERYLEKEYEPLNIAEMLDAVQLTELKDDLKQWLEGALRGNARLHYYKEADKYIYKPTLGHQVRKRYQLLDLLKQREREGLGGVTLTDVRDALPAADKAIKKLDDDIIRVTKGDRDKEELLFYNNKDYMLEVDEMFISHWRSISVEGQSDTDIERYLQNVGLGAMQGAGRKRPASELKKGRNAKKSRSTKVLNTHLDSELLKDYSEDGTQVPANS